MTCPCVLKRPPYHLFFGFQMPSQESRQRLGSSRKCNKEAIHDSFSSSLLTEIGEKLQMKITVPKMNDNIIAKIII